MWASVGEASRCLDAAFGGRADLASRFDQAFGPTRFIHLSRGDKAAQATSLVRAEQTGLWHIHADGSERERVAAGSVPTFDHERLCRARDDLIRDDTAWLRFFAKHAIVPLQLTYEALSAAPRSALADLLAALGRDPERALAADPRSGRMADAISAAWTARLNPPPANV